MKSKLEQMSSKLGEPIEKLQAQFLSIVKQVKEMKPDISEDNLLRRAHHILAVKYAAAMRPSAIAVEAVWYTEGPRVDYNRRMFEFAERMRKEDPETAVANYIIDGEGKPLDTREWLIKPTATRAGRKNPNFRKSLQHFYQKRIVGFGRRFGEGGLKVVSATLRGNKTELKVPMLKPSVSRFNIRSEDENLITMTSSVATEFKPSTAEDLKGFTSERLTKLLADAPFKYKPVDLEEFHSKYKGIPGAVCIVEADLIGVRQDDKGKPLPTSTGNFLIWLGDVEESPDIPPVGCFITKEVFAKIDNLGNGSRLVLTGSTTLGQDLTTGERTRMIFNAIDIRVLFAISPEESKLSLEVPTAKEWGVE